MKDSKDLFTIIHTKLTLVDLSCKRIWRQMNKILDNRGKPSLPATKACDKLSTTKYTVWNVLAKCTKKKIHLDKTKKILHHRALLVALHRLPIEICRDSLGTRRSRKVYTKSAIMATSPNISAVIPLGMFTGVASGRGLKFKTLLSSSFCQWVNFARDSGISCETQF